MTLKNAIINAIINNNKPLNIYGLIGIIIEHNLYDISQGKADAQFRAEVGSQAYRLFKKGIINRMKFDGIFFMLKKKIFKF